MSAAPRHALVAFDSMRQLAPGERVQVRSKFRAPDNGLQWEFGRLYVLIEDSQFLISGPFLCSDTGEIVASPALQSQDSMLPASIFAVGANAVPEKVGLPRVATAGELLMIVDNAGNAPRRFLATLVLLSTDGIAESFEAALVAYERSSAVRALMKALSEDVTPPTLARLDKAYAEPAEAQVAAAHAMLLAALREADQRLSAEAPKP